MSQVEHGLDVFGNSLSAVFHAFVSDVKHAVDVQAVVAEIERHGSSPLVRLLGAKHYPNTGPVPSVRSGRMCYSIGI